MITIISLWEHGWLEPSIEAFMWKQLTKAYNVDKVIFAPERLERRNFPVQTDSVADAIELAQGELIFLIPGEGESLDQFDHPEDAVYVFGNAMKDNRDHAEGHRAVHISTPRDMDFFAINAAAIVLNDRRMKHVS